MLSLISDTLAKDATVLTSENKSRLDSMCKRRNVQRKDDVARRINPEVGYSADRFSLVKDKLYDGSSRIFLEFSTGSWIERRETKVEVRRMKTDKSLVAVKILSQKLSIVESTQVLRMVNAYWATVANANAALFAESYGRGRARSRGNARESMNEDDSSTSAVLERESLKDKCDHGPFCLGCVRSLNQQCLPCCAVCRELLAVDCFGSAKTIPLLYDEQRVVELQLQKLGVQKGPETLSVEDLFKTNKNCQEDKVEKTQNGESTTTSADKNKGLSDYDRHRKEFLGECLDGFSLTLPSESENPEKSVVPGDAENDTALLRSDSEKEDSKESTVISTTDTSAVGEILSDEKNSKKVVGEKKSLTSSVIKKPNSVTPSETSTMGKIQNQRRILQQTGRGKLYKDRMCVPDVTAIGPF